MWGDVSSGAGVTGVGTGVPGAVSTGTETVVGPVVIGMSGAVVDSTGGASGCEAAGVTLAIGAGGSAACGALGAIGARSAGENSASNARFGTCFAKPMSRVSQRPTGWPGSCSPPGAREPSPRVRSVSGRGTPGSDSTFDGVAPGSDGIANVEEEAWNVDGSDCDASCSSRDSGREGSGARPGCWLGSAGV